ncbi:MAG: cyclic nucleotide-binding domain-containing protein [Anaerolineae bacterium]|nr:cyclic nucleotide-binding domain-containing protein [Anaerolineae bacterium]
MPEQADRIKFLARVPLFQGLKEKHLRMLNSRFVARTYSPGQDIVTQGKGGAGLFIVLSGGAEAIRVRNDGSKAVVNTFGPTDYFGELALLDDEPRTASVVATEETECLVISQWEFFGALREEPDMAIEVLQEVARRFRRALNTL